MGKYFLGIATVFIVGLVAWGCLWLFDLVGVVKMNDLILNEVGKMTGLNNLAANYELGKKQSKVLQKKEKELANQEKQLAARETKLQDDLTDLQDQKQLWIKERSQAAKKEQTKGNLPAKTPAALEPEVKNYLSTIGAMKPEKAAAVIRKLPDETALLIFEGLRTKQAAKLMESLPPEYLIRLTGKRLRPAK
jgi:flagellar motility protein MotE (MotC chaperone)